MAFPAVPTSTPSATAAEEVCAQHVTLRAPSAGLL